MRVLHIESLPAESVVGILHDSLLRYLAFYANGGAENHPDCAPPILEAPRKMRRKESCIKADSAAEDDTYDALFSDTLMKSDVLIGEDSGDAWDWLNEGSDNADACDLSDLWDVKSSLKVESDNANVETSRDELRCTIQLWKEPLARLAIFVPSEWIEGLSTTKRLGCNASLTAASMLVISGRLARVDRKFVCLKSVASFFRISSLPLLSRHIKNQIMRLLEVAENQGLISSTQKFSKNVDSRLTGPVALLLMKLLNL